MKSVLISIQPKWCELICSGKKTVEVRKTKPKLETPFKCYIYCTKPPRGRVNMYNAFGIGGYAVECGGKVMGEFVCDRIDYIGWISTPAKLDWKNYYDKKSCLTSSQLYDYSNGGCYYEWHISDLVIYDKPRKLSEFKKINRDCWYADLGLAKRDCPECKNAGCMVQRPPQSWCYVESEE